MAKNNLNTFWAELIVEELVLNGVDHFCISPGSRSTPLVAAVARNENAKSIICYDERSLAYHALGYARATGKPAVIITTSGTAVANLYPAVVEASNDNIPMLILTADRPPELIDTGANQAIDQQKFFGNYVRWDFDLPCPSADVPPEVVLTTVDQAIFRTGGDNPGAVHINCRYREPLEPQQCHVEDDYIKNIDVWAEGDQPFTAYVPTQRLIGEDVLETAAEVIDGTDRGIIVVGKLTSDDERKAAGQLAGKLNWVVYADITSGLRITDCRTNIIRYFDQELLSDEFNDMVRPDIVLHIGGRTTSKRLGQFFDQNRTDEYIVIKDSANRYDPVHAVTCVIQGDVAEICSLICGKVKQQTASEYTKFFDEKAKEVDALIAKSIEEEETLSEAFVARQISSSIPEDSCLFLSSSMPIRDVDLYGVSGRGAITIGANRGVSGIDGVISTSTGFAVGKERMTTLLIGDIAFIHDVNALAMLKKLAQPVIIVVVNNRGGGIFHFLPISQSEDIFEEYFAAPHDFSFEGVCKTFDVDHYKVSDKESFVDTYQKAIDNALPAVIEVETDRAVNLTIRREIKKRILKVLENAQVYPSG